jgi:5-methylcytosine-specific restriction endonuclease McrA
MQAKPTITCAVADCGRPSAARGLCMHHYHRLRAYGDPLGSPPPRPGRRPNGTRTCPGCARTLPPTDFYGPYTRCKECERVQKQAYYQRTRAAALDRAKRRAEANRDAVLAYKKSYYLERRADLNAKATQYARTHPEVRRGIAKRYAATHPEMRRKHLHNWRARRRKAFIESVDIKMIYARDSGICQLCKKPVPREQASMDHIIPLSAGGVHAPWNVQLTHLRCNLKRNRGYIPAQTRLPL